MYDMSRSVQHQVAIMSVFDLKQETNDRISSHAFDEVGSSLHRKNTNTSGILLKVMAKEGMT